MGSLRVKKFLRKNSNWYTVRMAAYDNPSSSIATRKITEGNNGPNVPCDWALVKGKLKGPGGSDEALELASFTRIDVANLNLLKASGGALEVIAGVSE